MSRRCRVAHGIGDRTLAYEFAYFLASSRQKIWEPLLLGPTGYAICPDQLIFWIAGKPRSSTFTHWGGKDCYRRRKRAFVSSLPIDRVEYGAVIDVKHRLIGQAARISLVDESARPRRFRRLLQEPHPLAGRLCAFYGLQGRLQGSGLGALGRCNATAQPRGAQGMAREISAEIEIHKFAQFEFSRQWRAERFARPRNPHHGRYSDLCGARQRGCLGASRIISAR